MGSGSFLITLATAAVAIVLVLGLANMLRGGSPNRSQNLMRLRVVLQAVGDSPDPSRPVVARALTARGT